MPVVSKFRVVCAAASKYAHTALLAGLWALVLLGGKQLYGQSFAPAGHYLVDSLNLEMISARDKGLVDSLIDVYHSAATDSVRLEAISYLVEQSWDEGVWPQYNRWLHNYCKHRLARKQRGADQRLFKVTYANTLNNIGYWHNSKGNIDSALSYYQRGLVLQEELDDKAGQSGTLVSLAYIFLNQGLIEQSLEYYYRSLKLEEVLGNQAGVATALNGIGYIYYKQGETAKAQESYERSLAIRERLGNKHGIATCLNNLGLLLRDEGRFKEALTYYQRCLELEEALSDKSGLAVTLGNIGFVYSHLNEPDTALAYHRQSHELYRQLRDKLGMAHSLNSIAAMLFEKGELSKARQTAEQSLALARQLSNPDRIRDAAETLYLVSEKEQSWQKALSYYQLYVRMRDSVFNEQTVKASIHTAYRYKYDKKALADSIINAEEQLVQQALLVASEAERDALVAKGQNQRQLVIFLIIGLCMASVFALVLYSRLKLIKSQKRTIEGQNKDLEEKQAQNERHIQHIEEKQRKLQKLNQDLDEFAQITSHDLKTPLRGIATMVTIIAEDFPEMESGLQHYFSLIQERAVKANQLIDGILEYTKAGHKQAKKTDVDVGQLLRSMLELAINENEVQISLDSEFPVVHCNAYQLQQVFANLLANAIHHNERPFGEGRISISYERTDNAHLFSIADNGPGIPEHMQDKIFELFCKSHDDTKRDSTGIGLSIVRKLVHQNGGTVSLKSKVGKGSTFIVAWPV